MDTKEKVIRATKAATRALGTQKAVADALHVNKATVTYWMRGEKCSLESYFGLMEIAKKAKTHAAIVLAVFTAASVLTFSKPSDANDSEKQTAGKTYPPVYYVKSVLVLLSRLLSGFAALPGLRPS